MESISAELTAVLVDVGWLEATAAEAFQQCAAEDLLVRLDRAWRAAASGRPASRRRSALLAWLARCRLAGAAVTGDEVLDRGSAEAGGATRLAGWCRGIPAGRRTALVSSRLGRRRNDTWFATLRHACRQLEPVRDVLVTAAGTPSAPAIECAAQVFGLRRLRVVVPRDEETLARWLSRLRSRWPVPVAEGQHYEAWLSPRLPAGGDGGTDGPNRLPGIPLRDRTLIGCSDRIFVLSLREGGNIERALRWCLTRCPRPDVMLATGTGLVPAGIADELVGLGAVAWTVPLEAAPTAQAETRAGGVGPPILGVPPAAAWPYLTHWTRDQSGPWPDESEEDYLAQCVRGEGDRDRSAFATLLRIVQTEKLLGTSRAIRGGESVVCFTEVPLAELAARRVFRPHRGRWDCDGYGLCIRKSWLDQRGARPVYYAGEQDWDGLPAALRPFFQLRGTRGRSGHRGIDWTQEREWRHRGNLDLRDLPATDGLVFVPSRAEAVRLASVSRWPVAVLPAPKTDTGSIS